MVLVNGTVNSHSGAELLCSLVVSDLPQDSGQGGGTEMGGTRGHDLAHALCGYAVLRRRGQTQA